MESPPVTGVRLVTFDCYGTLIDWMGGLRSYLRGVLARHGRAEVDTEKLLARWERIQFEMLEPYRPYATILGESLVRVAAEVGLDFDPLEAGGLSIAMGDWPPFQDVKPSLGALGRRVPLAIVSNTDRAIMKRTREKLGIPLAGVVVAEDVGAYKPDPRVFTQALERLGAAPGETLHVSFSFEYDLVPARRLGLRTAWIRRPGPPFEPQGPADYVLEDLHALARLLGGGGGAG
jgi:2-haloalkanoic acid dehalogenase type II